MAIAEHIVCVECGGKCSLVQLLDPEDSLEPGDVLTYRCADCAERWDVVVDEADLTDDDPPV